MKVTLKVLLGVSALLFSSTQVYAAASATGSPLAAITPSAVAVNKAVGTSANFLAKFASFDCSFDPGNVAERDSQVATCTFVGALTTDRVIVTNPASGDVVTAWCATPVAAWVSAADTIKVRLVNTSREGCDQAAAAYQILLYRPNKN